MGEGSPVKAIPDDYPRVIPSLAVDGAASAIDFYRAVFGATVRLRIDAPGDRVGHAELQIGASVVMLADEMPGMGFLGPWSVGGTPSTISVCVEDGDAASDRRSRSAPLSCDRWRISSTATGRANSRTPSAIAGTWPATSRTCPRTR